MPGYINKKYSKKGGKITIYSRTPSFNTIRKNVKQSRKNVKPKTKSLSKNKKVDISRELELVDKILKDLKNTYKDNPETLKKVNDMMKLPPSERIHVQPGFIYPSW